MAAMQLTPVVSAGRQVIERYGASGFRISGVIWRGPVLVFPDLTLSWANAVAEPTFANLQPVVAHGGVEILLLGFGRRMSTVERELRAALRRHGIALEPMDTGAACRTYNVLVAEERHVAAALLPPI